DLYDPRTMPPALSLAHSKLDKAVDAAYGYKGETNDAGRVVFLFGLYQQLTSLLPATSVLKIRKKAKRGAIDNAA
ncbi:MAG: type IIL restriction-modification enzyme MmeI, partial [Sulfuriferula sp.]